MTYEEFQLKVKEIAEKAGLTQYELYYSEQEDQSVRVMNHEVSSFSSDKECGACFRCIYEGKMGYAATELFDEAQAEALVSDAMENASLMGAEGEAEIFEGSKEYQPAETKLLHSVDLADTAMKLYEAALQAEPRVQASTMAGAAQVQGRIELTNSAGLHLSNAYGYQQASSFAIVKEGEEQFSAMDFAVAPLQEADVEAIAKNAVQSAVGKIGAVLVPTGKYPVVFDAEAIGSVLRAYVPIFNADNAQKGLSLLAGKEGEVVAAENITIMDDPFYKESPVKASFDAEGVATSTKAIVEKGVLKTLMHNLQTAKKAGVPDTANASKAGYASPVNIAPYTFYIVPGTASQEELYQQAGDGILVTSVTGLHAGTNAITGDFSIQCGGYRIREGKKAEAITSFTVSGNFLTLLKQIRTVGADLKFQMPFGFTVIGAPSILTEELSVAGE